MKQPLIIERQEWQNARQRRLFGLITILAWGLWLYLLAPLLSLAAWGMGLRLFFVEMLLPENRDYLQDLLFYGGIILLTLALVVGWSQYNLRRFRGLDRRSRPRPVTVEEEAACFGLEVETVVAMKQARLMSVPPRQMNRPDRAGEGDAMPDTADHHVA